MKLKKIDMLQKFRNAPFVERILESLSFGLAGTSPYIYLADLDALLFVMIVDRLLL